MENEKQPQEILLRELVLQEIFYLLYLSNLDTELLKSDCFVEVIGMCRDMVNILFYIAFFTLLLAISRQKSIQNWNYTLPLSINVF